MELIRSVLSAFADEQDFVTMRPMRTCPMLDELVVAERLAFFISIGFFSVTRVPYLLEQLDKK
jgi:hypothetical protein